MSEKSNFSSVSSLQIFSVKTPTVGGDDDDDNDQIGRRKWVQERPLNAKFINGMTLEGPFVNPKGIALH